ncbi:MAG: M61 family metallopeptidase [Planctomycetes bacterium]|nr:M61 family metallopeptidase [Planctomycetota bacterium]
MRKSTRLVGSLLTVLFLSLEGQLLSTQAVAGSSPLPPTRYTVTLSEPQTQMVDVSIEFDDVGADAIDLMLPTWRPGRYVILDPAGTVRDVRAIDRKSGAVLATGKTDKSTWRIVTGGAEAVRIDYRIYANSLGDRTRHVDDSHAYLSGESVFMYWPQRRGVSLDVHVVAPDGWETSTGLAEHPSRPGTFVASDYDVLVDSPLEIGTHERILFDVDGIPHEIAIWSDAQFDADRMIADFSEIVRQQAAVFGNMPYDKYVFMIHAGRGAGGGTEHLNSTIMQTSRESLEDDEAYKRFLGLVSHEMFHTWNVKQLRPAGIHPYDYQRENYSKLFWVAEGTTSYYTPIILVRGGLKKPDAYLTSLGESIDRFLRRPGRQVQSLEESSFDAWIKFNRHTPDDVNSTVSFYNKGSLVSLLLDMEVRKRTMNEMSLDDVLRRLYEAFPLSGPGLTTSDLIATLEDMTNASFTQFYAEYVAGTAELDFESALDTVGLLLFFDQTDATKKDKGDETEGGDDAVDPENAVVPYLGLDTGEAAGGARVRSVRSDGPAYRAGLIPGDVIIAMNGRRVNAAQINKLVDDLAPGDTVTFQYFRYDQLREMMITLDSVPRGKWKIKRVDSPTDAQKAAWEDWLGQPWPGEKNGSTSDGDEAAESDESDEES